MSEEKKIKHPIVVGSNFIYNCLVEARNGVPSPIVNYRGRGLVAELNGYAIIPAERYIELRKIESLDFEECEVYEDLDWKKQIAQADKEIEEQKAKFMADVKAHVAELEAQVEETKKAEDVVEKTVQKKTLEIVK